MLRSSSKSMLRFQSSRTMLCATITPPDLDVATFVVQRMLKALIKAVVLTGYGGVSPASVRTEILPAVIGYLTAPRSQ